MLLTLPHNNASLTVDATLIDARERMREHITSPTAIEPFIPQRVLLTFITEGVNTITRRGENVTLQAGDAMLLWPHQEVRALLAAGHAFRAVNVVFEMPSQVPHEQIFPEIVRVEENTSELRRAVESCAHNISTGGQALAQVEFASTLLALSRLYLLRRETALSAPVRRALDLVRRRPESAPSRRELAAVADVSPSHLSHLVKRETGATLSTHISRARVAHACELMHGTRLNFSEIARALDMDLPRFSRLFKQVMGTSPRDYVRVARLHSFEDSAQFDK